MNVLVNHHVLNLDVVSCVGMKTKDISSISDYEFEYSHLSLLQNGILII